MHMAVSFSERDTESLTYSVHPHLSSVQKAGTYMWIQKKEASDEYVV